MKLVLHPCRNFRLGATGSAGADRLPAVPKSTGDPIADCDANLVSRFRIRYFLRKSVWNLPVQYQRIDARYLSRSYEIQT